MRLSTPLAHSVQAAAQVLSQCTCFLSQAMSSSSQVSKGVYKNHTYQLVTTSHSSEILLAKDWVTTTNDLNGPGLLEYWEPQQTPTHLDPQLWGSWLSPPHLQWTEHCDTGYSHPYESQLQEQDCSSDNVQTRHGISEIGSHQFWSSSWVSPCFQWWGREMRGDQNS